MGAFETFSLHPSFGDVGFEVVSPFDYLKYYFTLNLFTRNVGSKMELWHCYVTISILCSCTTVQINNSI